ncbi:hypothetical protein QJQ45_025165 [Haematococcus lacustris]|nr:hypothetical protein QJQ45_025165 [Haematococcus lacustris]
MLGAVKALDVACTLISYMAFETTYRYIAWLQALPLCFTTDFQRIGECVQRPLELCSWKDLKALGPVGKEYKQAYDRLPKGRQRLHRAAEYPRAAGVRKPDAPAEGSFADGFGDKAAGPVVPFLHKCKGICAFVSDDARVGLDFEELDRVGAVDDEGAFLCVRHATLRLRASSPAVRVLCFPVSAGASGSGQQDQGQGQVAKVVIAERRQVIKAALRGLVEAALPDLSPAQVDAIVAEVNKRMTMGSKQCVLAAVLCLSVLLQSFLGQPTRGFPAAGPAPGPPPPPDPACPPYAHPRIASRSSPRTAAAPAQLPPPVQLGIWDPQLLVQIRDAMELLTKASVIEHMMRGPHHHGIRLLPGEVAAFEQPSSAWPVAMLKQLDEEHLTGDGNSLNANATTIITSMQEFYRHPGRFIRWWCKAVGVVEPATVDWDCGPEPDPKPEKVAPIGRDVRMLHGSSMGTALASITWHWSHLLNRQLSTEVRTSLTRFRLGNSGLGVEKARFEGVTFIDRTCTRCTEGVVDDAMHFIFECTATSSIKEQPEFAMTLQNNNENLHDFMLSPCAPLFVHLALKCVTESPEPLEGEGGLAA